MTLLLFYEKTWSKNLVTLSLCSENVISFVNYFDWKCTYFAEVAEVAPYEEMALYYPQPNQKRPLILVGPPSIGRHELRQRLLDDTSKFAAPVPRRLKNVLRELPHPFPLVVFLLSVAGGILLLFAV